jgi:dTDP-4-amino-4,6-dideoxygalactose transaminase
MLKTRLTRIPLANPVLDEEMKEAALHALQNERFVGGESVHKFEEEFARYCGTRFAASTASGTAALVLSLIAEGVHGAEVVTTPASFVASANSIIHAGATPRFADINLKTYTVNWLSSRGVETGVHYTAPIHLQPVYREMFGYKGGQFPNSEALCSNELSIPMHPSLTSEDVEFISEAIHDFYQERSRRR